MMFHGRKFENKHFKKLLNWILVLIDFYVCDFFQVYLKLYKIKCLSHSKEVKPKWLMKLLMSLWGKTYNQNRFLVLFSKGY